MGLHEESSQKSTPVNVFFLVSFHSCIVIKLLYAFTGEYFNCDINNDVFVDVCELCAATVTQPQNHVISFKGFCEEQRECIKMKF